MRTVADILHVELPEDAAEDSISFLPLMKDQPGHARTSVIHHSVSGYFAIRQNQWKLSLCPASGGWTGTRPSIKAWAKYEKDGMPLVQLIDLRSDLGEQHNLAESNPEKVDELRSLLQQQVNEGRTTPGGRQTNDVEIIVNKRPKK